MLIYLRSFKLDSADDIIKGVRKLTRLEDLRKVVDLAKSRIDNLVNIQFCVTDKVQLTPEFQHRKPYKVVGVLEKINPKSFKIRFDGVLWTISKSMVQKAK